MREPAARSQILRTAIEQRIANAKGPQALTLYDRMKDALAPADRRALDVQIGATRADTATDAWLAREAGQDGPPLIERAGLDDGLSDLQRLILRAKIDARDSAAESSRLPPVKGLDDQVAAATKAIATQPSQYRIGTLNALAKAYTDAGAPEQADDTRRLASQESLLRLFAQAGVDAQQRRLDDFTGPERTMANAIMQHQADAFAKDPYAAGTALYPDVGAPTPITDFDGRIAQSRKIAARRNIDVAPWSAEEFAAAVREFAKGSQEERDAMLQRVNAFPDDAREPLLKALNAQNQDPGVMSDAEEEPLREGAQYAQTGSGNTRVPRVRPLTQRQLMEIDAYRSKMDVIRQLEPENEFAKRPSVRAPDAPLGKEEMRGIDEELESVRARAAERDLRREEEVHGESTPGARPDADELVRSAVPGG